MNKISLYEEIILARQGVLFIKGKPGTGKSAIMKQIAEKNKLKFFDIRLSQIDSSEILGIPRATKIDGIPVMEYCIPDWAFLSNKAKEEGFNGSLVFFDEMNRAKPDVFSASLQILLDKQIGFQFKFDDDVYFCAAGNHGEEDGCEVEELDMAIKGRIVTINHDIGFDINFWLDNFGRKNCNSYIVSFLDANPSYLYKVNENEDNYANPRSWTFLSNIIGKEKNIEKIIRKVELLGQYYVGTSVNRFLKYLRDTQAINIKDVISRYEQVEEILEKITRDKMKELVKELESVKLKKLKIKEIDNIIKFLEKIDDDERVGFFKLLSKNEYITEDEENNIVVHDNIVKIIKFFENDFKLIYEITEEELQEQEITKEKKEN